LAATNMRGSIDLLGATTSLLAGGQIQAQNVEARRIVSMAMEPALWCLPSILVVMQHAWFPILFVLVPPPPLDPYRSTRANSP
jgi:hypothetical protein